MAKKLRRFQILLDDESLLYFPGAFLSGKVLLELEEDTPAIGLYFHIIGEGVVRLMNKGRVSASDKENYIDFRMRLLGDSSARSESGSVFNGSTLNSSRVLVLSPGVHTFPFKLGLPLGLPSTFLGKHGWVQYFCRAELREPNGLVHKNQQVFLIMNPIDLNLEPVLLTQPFHCEIEEKIGMSCAAPGKITCRVRLDRGGYVPGESISLSALIENDSNCVVKKTRAVLTETIQYTAKNKLVFSETRELAAMEKGKIQANCAEEWRNELLYIPPIPPTNLRYDRNRLAIRSNLLLQRGCHLIRIQYDIYFVIVPKGAHKSIRMQLPIMMATYPIRNSDGTLKRRKGTYYPSTLPTNRPWLSASDGKLK